MNEQLEAYAVELVEAIKGIAPEALDVAVRITRLNSIQQLSLALIGVMIAGTAFAWGARWHLRFNAAKKIARTNGVRSYDERYPSDDGEMGAMFACLLGGMAGVVALLFLVDFWAWIGVFAPELRLARDALSRLVTGP